MQQHDPDPGKMLKLIRTGRSTSWSRLREQRPLAFFHEAARRVPAYKDFLKKNKIKPEQIKTFADFQQVPPVSKKNYLRAYPLEQLCWEGTLARPLVWTATSGSTGEPFYFPRGHKLDWEYSILTQLFLENGSKGPTLVIIGFGMGVWIGGLITYKAFEIAAQRMDAPVSIITPGINKGEIWNALRRLAPNFAQTILVGYPPFVKDIVDEAPAEGINLKKLNLRILSAAEAYTETFRDYLAEHAGIKNVCRDMLNIYGTADIGAMAWETPTSIALRRAAVRDRQLFASLFSGVQKTPTLAQYNPSFITFEAPQGELLLTGDNAIPLVRYAVGDHGGVMDFDEVAAVFKKHHGDIKKEIQKAGAGAPFELPFVYVYERADLSTKLYGAIIYPEHVREALQERALRKFVTGKFTMATVADAKHNQRFEINIELRPKCKPSPALEHIVKKYITAHLIEKNAEYRNNHSSMPSKVVPRVVFWPHEHVAYFKPGVKQKWVLKPKLA